VLSTGRTRRTVDVVTLAEGPAVATKPRLRFDRVVLELIARLQAGCGPVMPDGCTAVVTCTAPVRLSGKTAAALVQRIGDAVARGVRKDIAENVHGNAVRIRFARAQVRGAARLAAFVHNPDPGAAVTLLTMTQALVEGLAAAYAPTKPPGKRWLVVVNPGKPAGETWRYVYAALAPPPRYEKVLMTFVDGTVLALNA
jgi:hypothetical protein